MKRGRDVVPAHTPAAATSAGRHVFVAIGIDRYQHWRPLHNAVSDARGATELFKQLGFEELVPPLLDEQATGAAIEALVSHELDRKLHTDDSLVVFFAGHGGTRTRRRGKHDVRTGHLIAVDASSERDRFTSWIELGPWLQNIALLPAKHILVIIDACESGIALSEAVKWGRDSGPITVPFAAANTKPSRLLITSASDGEIAMDNGPSPGHSLFTGCLIEALTGGGLPHHEHNGRPATIGSELGSHLRRRVHAYPGTPGWKQTPDVGTFAYDERGEMVIPLLRGHTGERMAVPGRGSDVELAQREVRAEAVHTPGPSAIEPASSRPSARSSVAPAGTTSGEHEMRPRRLRGIGGAKRAVAVLVGLLLAGVAYSQVGTADTAVAPVNTAVAPADTAVAPADTAVAPVNPGHAPTAPPSSAATSTDTARALTGTAPVPTDHASSLAAAAHDPPVVAAKPMRRVLASRPVCLTEIAAPRGAQVTWGNMTRPVPTELPLPCGIEVTLTFRRPHFVDRIKSVTATKGGAPVRVRQPRVTTLVHVTSVPSGATISVAGLAVTATTPADLKLPQFERSTVKFAMDGYEPLTRKIQPAEDGAHIDAALIKRAPRSDGTP